MLEATLEVNGKVVKHVYGNVTDYIDGEDEITMWDKDDKCVGKLYTHYVVALHLLPNDEEQKR